MSRRKDTPEPNVAGVFAPILTAGLEGADELLSPFNDLLDDLENAAPRDLAKFIVLQTIIHLDLVEHATETALEEGHAVGYVDGYTEGVIAATERLT